MSKSKRKTKQIKCKNCGTIIDPKETTPTKQWTLASPMPDKDGNITITAMATWNCPSCGNTVRGTMGKYKETGKTKSKQAMLIELIQENPQIKVSDIAAQLGMKEEVVEKAIKILKKQGKL